uniref:hypothetical protein n=1 Tax=Clostridium sp. TaxID=1506 RepID=UPI0026354719
MCNKNNNILSAALAIDENIYTKGLKRYDVNDIRNLEFFSKNTFFTNVIRKGFQVIENFFPITLRKVLKIEKGYSPTAYTHLTEAYFISEKNNISLSGKIKSQIIIEQAIELYLRENKNMSFWEFEENFIYIDIESLDKITTMHMHGLARFNIALLKMDKYYDLPRYRNIAFRSAQYAIENHKITEYDNGMMSISYFYNSDDCTININTEFAQWLSMIPIELRNTNMNKLFIGIIKLVIEEQNQDGSWYYFTKAHMEKWGDKPSIDCHHTGTV